MFKSKLFNILILSSLTVPGLAMAADAPEHTVSSNIGLVSNYLYRGISQTGGNQRYKAVSIMPIPVVCTQDYGVQTSAG